MLDLQAAAHLLDQAEKHMDAAKTLADQVLAETSVDPIFYDVRRHARYIQSGVTPPPLRELGDHVDTLRVLSGGNHDG